MARICLASWEVHPVTQGGCGVFIHHATRQLLQRGHEVALLLDMPPEEFARAQRKFPPALPSSERCRLFDLNTLCEDFIITQSRLPNVYQWRSLRFAHALRKIEREQAFDVVEFFEYCGAAYYALVSKLFAGGGAPLAVRLHNSIEIIDRMEAVRPVDRERYAMYGLERGALDLAETILAPAQAYFEAYYRDEYSIAPERVIVSQTPREDFSCSRQNPDKTIRVLCLGRVHQFKGVEQLVKAAVLLLEKRPDLNCEFEFIGSDTSDAVTRGSYIETLKHMIPPPLRARFHFPGHLDHNAVAERMKSASLAVFPNRFESFCYALHEAYSAGLPVVINDLPAWRESFAHERNCLVYDGTTAGLLEALERMAADETLRQRLSCPYPVATNGLGDFYDAPRALAPLPNAKNIFAKCQSLVVILEEAGVDQTAVQATIGSLKKQTNNAFTTVRAREAHAVNEQSVRWLGRSVAFQDASGAPVDPLSIQTAEALLILRGGDVLDPDWMALCAGVLARSNLSFAGTWASEDGTVIPSELDLAPEGWPVWHGEQLTRALIRTHPGKLFIDLFDVNLGALGEIGYLWQAMGQWGRGCLYPHGMMQIESQMAIPDPRQLAYLLRSAPRIFTSRAGVLGAMLQQEYLEKLRLFDPQSGDAPKSLKAKLFEPAAEQAIKERIAESLGGLHLIKLIMKRWKTRKSRK